MRKQRTGFLFISAMLSILLSSATSYAQTGNQFANQTPPLGIVPYGPYEEHHVDTVNVSTGNAVIDIPLYSLPQLGDLSLSFSAIANSTAWQMGYSCTQDDISCTFSYYTEAVPSNGAIEDEDIFGPQITIDQGYQLASSFISLAQNTAEGIMENYSIVDRTLATHLLYYDATNLTQMRTVDGTRLLFQSSSPQPYNFHDISYNGTLIDAKGIQYAIFNDQTSSITDKHGNAITINQSSGTITDSVNRSISLPPSWSSKTSATTGCPDLSQSPYNATYQPITGSAQWVVPGPNGRSVTYLVCYTAINVQTNFWKNNGQTVVSNNVPGSCGDEDQSACNFIQTFEETSGAIGAIQSIVSPDNTFWGFIYDSANPSDSSSFGYGTLKTLIEPSGGTINYSYAMNTSCIVSDPSISAVMGGGYWSSPQITQRTESDLQGHTYTWQYKGTGISSGQFPTVTDPNGNDTVYEYELPNNENGCGSGYEASTNVYQGSHSAGVLLESRSTSNQFGAVPLPNNFNQVDPYPGVANGLPIKQTTTIDGVASLVKNTGYDSVFLAAAPSCWESDTNNCDTGGASAALANSPSPIPLSLGLPISTQTSSGTGSVLNSTQTSYAWGSNTAYWSNGLVNTPTTTTTYDGSNNMIAQTKITYDESAYSSCGVCGNPTSISRWNNTGSAIQTHTAWTSTGMIDHTVDALGNTNQINTYSSTYKGLYPTSITNALSQTTTIYYDFNTGQKTSITDPNQQKTTYTFYNDGNLQSIQYPDGGGAQYAYSTDATPVTSQSPTITVTTATGSASGSIINSIVYDGLGRKIHSQLVSDPLGSDDVDITYDGLDHVASVTNPYRGTIPSGITTYYSYDAIGRKTIQKQQDGNLLQWCYDNISTMGQSDCHPNASSISSALWVDSSDENGHVSQRVNDVFGRLVAAMEQNPQQGSSPSYAFETDYKYDALNNLGSVMQWGGAYGSSGGRSRSFSYDSLSRLVCASNPENSSAACPTEASSSYVVGTTGYTYDANSNVLTKTSPAINVTSGTQMVTYGYDALNRLLSKTYTNAPAGTLSNCFQYDSASKGIGHLAAEWTQPGSCASSPPSNYQSLRAFGAYDAMGRVVSEQQCAAGYCTSASVPSQPSANCTSLSSASGLQYCYDLAGNLLDYSNGVTTQTAGSYPQQALLFSQKFDSAGHLATVNSSWSDTTHPATLFSNTTYSPAGALSNWLLGTSLWTSRQYDNRLRVCNQQSAQQQITAPQCQ